PPSYCTAASKSAWYPPTRYTGPSITFDRNWTPELPVGVVNLYLNCNSKSENLAGSAQEVERTRNVCLDFSRVALPSIAPSFTDQNPSNPSQLERSFPLNRVMNPSA